MDVPYKNETIVKFNLNLLTISNIDIILEVEITIFDINFKGDEMPREKFQTLTEQMFYILICLQQECCGIDIMEMVKKIPLTIIWI